MTIFSALPIGWRFIEGIAFGGLCIVGIWIIRCILVAAIDRITPAIRTTGIAAGDTVGVLLAIPFEWAADRADSFIARGAEWRAQRKIWRKEFRSTMNWEEFQEELAGKAKKDDWADALKLFGLAEPFSRQDLDTHFKRIMLRVHPDQGGSEFLTVMANDARTTILERKGWNR